MGSNWNSGMDYSFSIIKKLMWILGVWPLQRSFFNFTAHWVIIFIVQTLTTINLLMEMSQSCGDEKDDMEVFLIIETAVHGWINIVFARIHMKTIASNVNCAIDDWSSSLKEKRSYTLMIGYARIGRLVAAFQITVGVLGIIIYFGTIIIVNNHQVVTVGNETVILWNFVLPSTCLFQGVSYSTYKALYAMQFIQAFIMFIAEIACESFFFSITMHLCGQFELLRIDITEIERKIDTKNRNDNVLTPWIRRHCHLIKLARNIEDSFNMIIFFRLSMITLVIAASGMRMVTAIKIQAYNDIMKDLVFIQFFIVQSFLFTHAGDTLQSKGESIINAIYDTTWHELPAPAMRDLVLIMMRTNIPERLSAGKFFYITRSTTTDIMKTALSYISFLQVAMKD